MELANDFQARGTPHFFINGVRLSGAQPFEKFKETIDEQLAKAKAAGRARRAAGEGLRGDHEGRQRAPAAREEGSRRTGRVEPVQGRRERQGRRSRSSRSSSARSASASSPTMDEIEKEYGNKVKIVWRNLPLPFHKDAPLAAEACAGSFKQKGNAGFWKYPRQAVRGSGAGPHALSAEPREDRDRDRPRHGQVQGRARLRTSTRPRSTPIRRSATTPASAARRRSSSTATS